MTAGETSDVIRRAAAAAGFDRCGIAPAGPIGRGEFLRAWLRRGYAGTMGYLHRHVESRIDVRAWLPAARSVIVVALCYRQPADASIEEPADGAARGRVAVYAWGEDYHVVMREKLDGLVGRMRRAIDRPFDARVCVDTSAILERELAARAGIGWIGKNTMVLNASLGSFFFLGEIITDLPLTPDAPEPDHCGTCTRCVEACPTGAFPQPYAMDARRCISYLTIEHRGEIAPALAAAMGDWVFGCDVCQTVCPFNRRVAPAAEPRFAGSAEAGRPRLADLLAETRSEYKTRVENKATARARPEMWKRNAEIVRRNLRADV
ncbi:MAG: tRNA epoxyqueuosine(34) reductase QueG [Phycisphaerae bacterium]